MAATKIVVVEDERIVAFHLKRQLTKLGYEVSAIAASGDRALQQVNELRPDVVLMDIHIEGDIDGIETAGLIPVELQIPVIYLTAFSDDDTLARARATTPYGYLLKPFTERELHATIQMVLARRSADMASRDAERRLERQVVERTADLVAANRELEEQTAVRLKAERQLAQVQKIEAVGQLTGGVAHEMNNVLMVITGCLDRIGADPDDTKRVISSVESANNAVERGARLIRQLLMFSRRQVMFPKVTDPNTLIEEFELLMARGTPENIELTTRLAPDVGHCHIDPAEFLAAILNLVLNARDAISGHGRIFVETENVLVGPERTAANEDAAPGSYVVVTVTDTGSGIPPDILSRVFEPFFTTKEVGKGTGLGLSQVYGFAKASGGYVVVDSEIGLGTTVRLYMPRSGERQVDPEAANPRGPSPATTGAETVLIVEDDESLLAITSANLADRGYRLLLAPNAAAALSMLEGSEPIDIMFSDVVLPGAMNGMQLALAARRLRPTMKVLLTSGYAAAALAAQQGFDETIPLLQKPYRIAEVTRRFRGIANAA
jgi:signal transduction histidine kinase